MLISIKDIELAKWIRKQDPYIYFKKPISYQKTQTESKGIEKDNFMQIETKRAGISIFRQNRL